MTDHIARVQEQAEREAVGVFGKQRESDLLPADYYQAGQMSGYIMGQIALASRLTREKIVDAIAGGTISVPNGYGSLHYDDAESIADAILALLTEGGV